MTRLIDADALFINLDGMMEVSPTGYIHGETVADMISDAPTVDAMPVRHGKWLCSDDMYETAVCSVCNCDTEEPYEYVKKSWNVCKNCGAKMDAEREEE